MIEIGEVRLSASMGPKRVRPTRTTRHQKARLTRAALQALVVALLFALFAAATMVGCSESGDPLAEIREFQEKREFAKSIAPLRAMLDENPAQPEANFLLGKALMRTGDTSSAIWPLRRSMESPEYVVAAGLMLGRAELASRTPRDVLEAADLVLEQEPDNVEALTIRAQGYLKASREVDALADLDRVLELDPENLEALVPRVVALIELELIEDAEKALVRANEVIQTTEQDVREQLRGRLCVANGLFAFEKGDIERATTLYEECLEIFPTSRLVISQSVTFFDRLKQPKRATEILRGAFEEANTPHFRNTLARRMGRMGQRDEQEKLLRAEAEERPTPRAWFALADFYVVQERFDEACGAFEKALEGNENPAPMTVFAYVDTLIQAERFDDARRETAKVDQEHMRDLLEGRLLLATGDAEGALRAFEAGLRLWPNNLTARYLAGLAAEQLGDFDRAIGEYREAIRKRKDTGETEAALNLAQILTDKGTPKAAYTSLNRYIATNPHSKEALLLAIRIGREIRRPKVIAQSMTGLVNAGHPGLAMAQQIEILSADSGPESAIAATGRSRLNLTDPKNSLALRGLIEQYAVLDRHDEARALVAAALELHPDAAEFHDLSGRAILAASGDAAEARAAFERSLAIEPERATALAGLAELAVAIGAYDEAIAFYDRALLARPEDSAPAWAVLALLQAADQYEERERRLAAMVASHPRDALAANALAQSLGERGGDLDRALSFAKRAAVFVTVPEATETLGWVHLLRGEHAIAIEILQAAADSQPSAASARYRLGLALAASGESERARESFDAVIAAGGAETEKARSEIARLDLPQ